MDNLNIIFEHLKLDTKYLKNFKQEEVEPEDLNYLSDEGYEDLIPDSSQRSILKSWVKNNKDIKKSVKKLTIKNKVREDTQKSKLKNISLSFRRKSKESESKSNLKVKRKKKKKSRNQEEGSSSKLDNEVTSTLIEFLAPKTEHKSKRRGKSKSRSKSKSTKKKSTEKRKKKKVNLPSSDEFEAHIENIKKYVDSIKENNKAGIINLKETDLSNINLKKIITDLEAIIDYCNRKKSFSRFTKNRSAIKLLKESFSNIGSILKGHTYDTKLNEDNFILNLISNLYMLRIISGTFYYAKEKKTYNIEEDLKPFTQNYINSYYNKIKDVYPDYFINSSVSSLNQIENKLINIITCEEKINSYFSLSVSNTPSKMILLSLFNSYKNDFLKYFKQKNEILMNDRNLHILKITYKFIESIKSTNILKDENEIENLKEINPKKFLNEIIKSNLKNFPKTLERIKKSITKDNWGNRNNNCSESCLKVEKYLSEYQANIIRILDIIPIECVSDKLVTDFINSMETLSKHYDLLLNNECDTNYKIYEIWRYNHSPKKIKKKIKKILNFDNEIANESMLKKLFRIYSNKIYIENRFEMKRDEIKNKYLKLKPSANIKKIIAKKQNIQNKIIAIFISQTLIFIYLENSLISLYTKSSDDSIIDMSKSFLKECKNEIELCKKNICDYAFREIISTLFLVIMSALEWVYLESEITFSPKTCNIFRNDLSELYHMFKEYDLNTSLGNNDQVILMSNILTYMEKSHSNLIKIHKSLVANNEREGYPSKIEYFSFPISNGKLPTSHNFDSELNDLSEIGLLKLISKQESETCRSYVQNYIKGATSVIKYITIPVKSKKEISKFKNIENVETLSFVEVPIFARIMKSIKGANSERMNEMTQGEISWAVTEMFENQKQSKHQWTPTTSNPSPFTDLTSKIEMNKEDKPPQSSIEDCVWRWVSEWMVDEKGWGYSNKFSDDFKYGKQNILHNSRRRKWQRVRILDKTDLFEKFDDSLVYTNLRKLLCTLIWAIYNRVKTEADSSSNNKKETSESSSTKKDQIKNSASPAIINPHIIYDLSKKLLKTISLTNFTSYTEIENFKTSNIFVSISNILKECYVDDSSYSKTTAENYFETIEKIIEMVSFYKKEKRSNKVLILLFIEFIVNSIEFISDNDDIASIVSLAFMKNDLNDENEVFYLGLLSFDFVKYIQESLEDGEILENDEEWKRYIKSNEGKDKLTTIFNKIEKWLKNYHDKGESDEISMIVGGLMEAIYYLGKIGNKYKVFDINAKSLLRKLMQSSIKYKLKKLEDNHTKDIDNWAKEDWNEYTEDIKNLLISEVDCYQSSIIIPTLKDPIKTTVTVIVSTICEKINKIFEETKLSIAVIGALCLNFTLSDLILHEWSRSELISLHTINSLKPLIPEAEQEARKRLKNVVNSQYNQISEWISASINEEHEIEDGKYTSFYSDAFSFLSNFCNIFLDLLKEIPGSLKGRDIYQDFEDIFQQLVIKFLTLSTKKIGDIDEIMAKILPSMPKYLNYNLFYSKKSNTKYDGDLDLERVPSIKILCQIYSNLCLALERLKEISKDFINKINKITSSTDDEEIEINFTIELEPSDFIKKIDSVLMIMAHKAIYQDMRKTIFENHYTQNHGTLHSEFENIEKELSEIIDIMNNRIYLKSSKSNAFQALFDVFVNSIIWLLLRSDRNYEQKEIEEVESDLELFQLFSNLEDVDIETFEIKSLKLIIKYFKMPPTELIEEHDSIEDEYDYQDDMNSGASSVYIYEPACVLKYIENNQSVKITKKELTFILLHIKSKEASKYAKKYIKTLKKTGKEITKTGNKDYPTAIHNDASLTKILELIVVEFKVIQRVISTNNTEFIKSISTIQLKDLLKILQNFIYSIDKDRSKSWKHYLNNERTLGYTNLLYKNNLSLVINYHSLGKAVFYSKAVGALLLNLLRIGTLLSRCVDDFKFEELTYIKSIIKESADERYKTFRSQYSKKMLEWKTKTWNNFTTDFLEINNDEIGYYILEMEDLEIKYIGEYTIYIYFSEFINEISNLLNSITYKMTSLKTFGHALNTCKILREYLIAIKGPEDLEGQLNYTRYINTDKMDKLIKKMPNIDNEINIRIVEYIKCRIEKLDDKYEEICNNENWSRTEGNVHSKSVIEIFYLLEGLRKNFIEFLKNIHKKFIPKNVSDSLFSELEKFIIKYLKFIKKDIGSYDNLLKAIKKTEKVYVSKKDIIFKEEIINCYDEYNKIKFGNLNSKEICTKFEDIRYLQFNMQNLKSNMFYDLDELSVSGDIFSFRITEFDNQQSNILTFWALSFICTNFGNELFGDLLRRKKSKKLEINKDLFDLIIESMNKLKNEIESNTHYEIIYYSICTCVLDMIEWIILHSERTFSSKDSIFMVDFFKKLITCLNECSISKTDKMKHRAAKKILKIMKTYSSIPEKNILLHKKLVRNKKAERILDEHTLLSILAHSNSVEARKYAELYGEYVPKIR